MQSLCFEDFPTPFPGRYGSTTGLSRFGGFLLPLASGVAVEGLTYKSGSPLGTWNGVWGLGGLWWMAQHRDSECTSSLLSRGAKSSGWLQISSELVNRA